jgi:flavorubredoxin
MSDTFKAAQVTERVWWVGAIDWDVRNFHGYRTGRGTTYNAFLIIADKITLVDTVKAEFQEEMMARISSVIDPAKIDVIISNHAEMDHSGCLPQTIAAVNPEAVYCSKIGQRALQAHFGELDLIAVDEGQQIDLGGATVSFVETKMCHWPDSMVTYLHEDQLLFSQDAFGMHFASHQRYADELDPSAMQYEAAKYFANILLHLSPFIDKTIAKMGDLGLPLKFIAPDHGPIYRTPELIDWIVSSYGRWAAQTPTNKAVVVYDTMWHSTATLAKLVGEGLVEGGVDDVCFLNLSEAHRSDVITELLEAGMLVVGSPTMNNNILPSMGDIMTYLKGLRPRNLIGAAFGSFGWSGEAPKQLHAMLEEMGLDMVADPLRVNYVPNEAEQTAAREFGLTLAAALKDRLNN